MTPQHYPLEEGILYAGEYPGAESRKVAKARLRSLIDLGVRTFVDLTAPADRLEPYAGWLAELAAEIGKPLQRISIPIRDMGIPDSIEIMRTIQQTLHQSTREAPAVYVHCWGGIGRTGIVAGCWLRECGYAPDAALARVQVLYTSHMPKCRIHPFSPQTIEQRSYIRHWQPEI